MDTFKKALAKITNQEEKEAYRVQCKGADVFIGLSAPNIITTDDIREDVKEFYCICPRPIPNQR